MISVFKNFAQGCRTFFSYDKVVITEYLITLEV